MLQVYVPKVSSALDVCCIQVFYVASVSCFRGMFRESLGHCPNAMGRGAVSRGPADGGRGASGISEDNISRTNFRCYASLALKVYKGSSKQLL